MESARITIHGILAENANSWWPLLSGWCENALSYGGGLLGLDDIQAAVASRDMQLWAILINDSHVAVCVTEIRQWPKGKALTSILVGGDRMNEWIGELDKVLKSYAQATGCKVMDAYGRKGWRKSLEGLGWRSALVTYIKEV